MLSKYQSHRSFTDHDAWSLFKLAAFGEAIGWTLLIIGILCTKLSVSWSQYPVHFFGMMHGMLFFAYIYAVLLLSPSLHWPLPQTIIAGLCSVPPYGTLIYEKWVEYQRNQQHLTWLAHSIRYQHILES